MSKKPDKKGRTFQVLRPYYQLSDCVPAVSTITSSFALLLGIRSLGLLRQRRFCARPSACLVCCYWVSSLAFCSQPASQSANTLLFNVCGYSGNTFLRDHHVIFFFSSACWISVTNNINPDDWDGETPRLIVLVQFLPSVNQFICLQTCLEKQVYFNCNSLLPNHNGFKVLQLVQDGTCVTACRRSYLLRLTLSVLPVHRNCSLDQR